MNAIVETQQCQEAKMMSIRSVRIESKFPLDCLLNYPRFTLRICDGIEDNFKPEFIKKLMKFGKVQECVLYLRNGFPSDTPILDYFNEPEAMVPEFPNLRRYPIPGSNKFYEMEHSDVSVRLERKR